MLLKYRALSSLKSSSCFSCATPMAAAAGAANELISEQQIEALLAAPDDKTLRAYYNKVL